MSDMVGADRLLGHARVPRSPSRWRARLIVVLLCAVLIPAGVAVVRLAPPTESTYYPRCLFKWATGLNCPGCGATRCVHALLIGEFAQAFAYNPLFVIGLPFLLIGTILECYGAWTGRSLVRGRLPRWAILLIFWLLIAYWVARNIDLYPFTLLAPHELVLD
jgi:hypothetical protein